MAIALQLDPSKVDRAQRLPTLKAIGTFEMGVAYIYEDEAEGQRVLDMPGSPFMRARLKEARVSGQVLDAAFPMIDSEQPAPPEAVDVKET